VEEMLRHNGLPGNILVDCSHGNSEKDYNRQPVVLQDVIGQRIDGRSSIKGFMLESNINPGRQDLVAPEKLAYGTSITDACVGWNETAEILRETAERLRSAR
jgi:3-deoxy-7-phosphoheptulonate synthase